MECFDNVSTSSVCYEMKKLEIAALAQSAEVFKMIDMLTHNGLVQIMLYCTFWSHTLIAVCTHEVCVVLAPPFISRAFTYNHIGAIYLDQTSMHADKLL